MAAGLVAVCGLVGSPRLGAQAGEPISPPIVRTLSSTILTLDRDVLTLTLADGHPDDLFAAGPDLRARFAAHEIGDVVSVTFYDARVVGITLGGGGSLPEGVRPGQTPGVRPFIVDATVSALDFFGRSITVRFSSGPDRTFGVTHESLLVGVQVGDTVTLTVSRPLLSALEFAP